jgi:hypothetical protein
MEDIGKRKQLQKIWGRTVKGEYRTAEERNRVNQKIKGTNTRRANGFNDEKREKVE